jgi:hypothetical protein
MILQALKEIAIDCLLFRDYNADPSVPLCYGQQPQQPQQSRGPAFDRFCATSQHLLLQDEDDTDLVEFSTTNINPEGVRLTDAFERSCKLARAPVITLGPVGYRDLLILEALKAPTTVDPKVIERQYSLGKDDLIIREVLQMLARPNPDLQEELKLWMLVSALSDASRHRGALERFIQHRVDRTTDDKRGRLSGMVEQITTWMRLRLELDMAVDALQRFLRDKPTLANLLSARTAPPAPAGPATPLLPLPPLPPRVLVTPSAPPLTAGSGGRLPPRPLPPRRRRLLPVGHQPRPRPQDLFFSTGSFSTRPRRFSSKLLVF